MMQKEIKLPKMDLVDTMVAKLQRKYQFKNQNPTAAKRGRRRHGLYRKQQWSKTQPKNTYEPRIVHQFQFRKEDKISNCLI